MAASPEQVAEHFATLSRMNDTLTQQITQTQTRLQEAHDLIQQNINEITTCKNQITVLTNENADLNNRLLRLANTPTEPNKSRDLLSRITKTDLLKSKEIPSFHTKDSFEQWSDYFQNDLYAKLPETKLLIDFAEKTAQRQHSTQQGHN